MDENKSRYFHTYADEVRRLLGDDLGGHLYHAQGLTAEQAARAYVDDVTSQPNLDDFTLAYIEAALWASNATDDATGEEYESLEQFDIDDIDAATLAVLIADCAKFQAENKLPAYGHREYSDAEMAGHDFWLTRNGHGAGFWDRGLGEVGEQLSDAARNYGEFYLWLDSGKIFGE